MADYVDGLIADGETILIRARQHWFALIQYALRPILILLVAAGLWLLGQWFNPDGLLSALDTLITWAFVIAFVIGILWFPVSAARWLSRRYILTDRRTIRVEGLLNKHSFDSQLEKINDVRLEQSALGRMLGYADLDVDTAASEDVVEFPMIRDAIEFKKRMMDAKHALGSAEYRHYVVGPPIGSGGAMTPAAASATAAAMPTPPLAAPAATPPATPLPPPAQAATPVPAHVTSGDEVTEALDGLAALRDRGAITEDEFQAKKADLLGRI